MGGEVALELLVLGCAGSHPGVGRMCSGYLVRSGATHVLVDAGNGSTGNLQRHLPLRDLDAVVVSHRHIDHCVDLVGGFYNLRYDPAFVGRRLPLHAADGVHATLTSLLSDDSAAAFDDVFAHAEVGDGDRVEIGPLALRFARSIHTVPTVSTRVEVGGASLVYSGDSAGGEDLVHLARGADALLCEATWAGDAADYPPGLHLTATGAAEVARAAGVGRLLLTHVAGATDRDRVLEEADAVFDGPVELVDDLRSYRIA